MHVRIETRPTDELTEADVAAIRDVLTAAFAEDEHGGFTEDDWQHALGGTHFLAIEDRPGERRIVGHASVIERELHLGEPATARPAHTGYVEAVAVEPAWQRQGLGSRLMQAVNAHIDEGGFELGALGTGSQPFYQRLGWEIWRGPTFVRTARGVEPTPDEDGYILVRRTAASPPLQLTDPISCDWRPGDAW